MDVKELAAYLREDWEKIGSKGLQPIWDQVTDNFELVVKALETVAGIEMLKDHRKTLSVTISKELGTHTITVKTMDGLESFYGTDLRSAVRAAVEAREKGA